MKAGVKPPLVLAAIAALLGGYILFCERGRETTDQAVATRQQLFPGLARAEVTAIEIDRGAKGRVTLIHDAAAGSAGAWRLAQNRDNNADGQNPGAGPPAAGSAVDELLDAADGLDVDRVATASPDVAGLTPPVARLAITSPAGRFALDVGGVDASKRGVFVRRQGEAPILVVARRLKDLVDRDAGAFRDRRLFGATAAGSASALAFQSPGAARQTLRQHGGLWLDEAGELASPVAVAEALHLLTTLEASGFPDTTITRPPAPPRWTVELTAAAPARLEVWGGACGAGAGADGGASHSLAALTRLGGSEGASPAPSVWFCLNPDGVGRLWRSLEAANRRDPKLLVVDPATADGVLLVEGDRRLHLRRAGDDWRFAEPAGLPYAADAKGVDAWLARLAQTATVELAPTQARDAASKAAGPPPRPTRRLTIEGATPISIEIAAPHGGQVRVDRIGEVAPATTAAVVYAELDPEPLRFRSRAVLALPRLDVVTVQIRAHGRRIELRRASGDQWVTGAAAPADSKAIDQLLDRLADLTAERFLTPSPPFTPDTTVDADVEVHVDGGQSARHVRLELSASCQGRLADTPLFSLGTQTCQDLHQAIARLR